MPRPLPTFRRGDVLKAQDLTDLRAAVMRQRITTGAGSGIILQESPDGTMIAASESAAVRFGYCQLASTLGPATGAWPSITPTSRANVTVYQAAGGALASLGTFTLYNFRNVTWAASKTTFVVPCADDTWQIVDQDC